MFGIKKEMDDREVMTNDELDRVHKLVEEIGKGRTRGFFIVMEAEEEFKENVINATCIGKMHNVNGKMVMDSMFETFGLKNSTVAKYLMLRTLDDPKLKDL